MYRDKHDAAVVWKEQLRSSMNGNVVFAMCVSTIYRVCKQREVPPYDYRN